MIYQLMDSACRLLLHIEDERRSRVDEVTVTLTIEK
jgi:hypothetical protein